MKAFGISSKLAATYLMVVELHTKHLEAYVSSFPHITVSTSNSLFQIMNGNETCTVSTSSSYYNEPEEMLMLENAQRPPPPPPAPPSTPVIKAQSQKHHHQLLQQLPHMLANGLRLSRPQDYMWLDPSGRPTSPPRPTTSLNKAQSSRKVYS